MAPFNPADPVPDGCRCFSCLEPITSWNEAIPACDSTNPTPHGWHYSCARERMEYLARSKTTDGFGRLHCCDDNYLPPQSVQKAKLQLSLEDLAKYEVKEVEFATPPRNRLYCFSCSRFLFTTDIIDGIGTCPACNTQTCKGCAMLVHEGECTGFKDELELHKLAEAEGWKSCPGCGVISNKTAGCNHMMCACGKHWCFLCRRTWKQCGCALGGLVMDDDDDDEEERREQFEIAKRRMIYYLTHALAIRAGEPFANWAKEDNHDLQLIFMSANLNPMGLRAEEFGLHLFDSDAAEWLNLITQLPADMQQIHWERLCEQAQATWTALSDMSRENVEIRRQIEGRRGLPAVHLQLPNTYKAYCDFVYTKRLIITGESNTDLVDRIEFQRYGQWGPRQTPTAAQQALARQQHHQQSRYYRGIRYGAGNYTDAELLGLMQTSHLIDNFVLSGRARGREVDTPQRIGAHFHAWTPSVVTSVMEVCAFCHAPMVFSKAVCTMCETDAICTLCAVTERKTPELTPADYLYDQGPVL